MFQTALHIVLSLLLLMPQSICICGGGAQTCLNHPSPDSARVSDDVEQANNGHHCCSVGQTGDHTQLFQEHRCPEPLPHKSSCPVVERLADQTAPEIAQHFTPALASEVIIVHFPVLVCRKPVAPLAFRTSTPPLFIAHCTLLI